MIDIKFEDGSFHIIHKADSDKLHEDPIKNALLKKLRAFLDTKEPQLVKFLIHTWNTQGRAITYKELREAILIGEIDEKLLDDWQQDYSRFVKKYLLPAWQEAVEAGAEEIKEKYPDWYFNPMSSGIRSWTEIRSADFVTNSTQTQIEGIRAVVYRAANIENISVDELARVIRPMVGLTARQATSNLRYYENLRNNGVSEKRAKDLSVRYAARQHRYRGYNIARTELAFAYNKGADDAVRQAQAAGYMGETVKEWSTALDERVCDTCRALEGKRIAMDDEFDFKTRLEYREPGIKRTPPAHPSCRCAVKYVEIAPPAYR